MTAPTPRALRRSTATSAGRPRCRGPAPFMTIRSASCAGTIHTSAARAQHGP
jgi:hypothetical protein